VVLSTICKLCECKNQCYFDSQLKHSCILCFLFYLYSRLTNYRTLPMSQLSGFNMYDFPILCWFQQYFLWTGLISVKGCCKLCWSWDNMKYIFIQYTLHNIIQSCIILYKLLRVRFTKSITFSFIVFPKTKSGRAVCVCTINPNLIQSNHSNTLSIICCFCVTEPHSFVICYNRKHIKCFRETISYHSC
jgi:hypothetical protein